MTWAVFVLVMQAAIGALCPNLQCRVFANTTSCHGANETVSKNQSCFPPFCFRCLILANRSASQVAACGTSCDASGDGISWSDLQPSLCAFGVGVSASLQCAAIT